MTMTTTTAPVWHRDSRTGAYSTGPVGDHEYTGTITRSSTVTFGDHRAWGWRLESRTFGRFLDGGHFRTLAQAKTHAALTLSHLA